MLKLKLIFETKLNCVMYNTVRTLYNFKKHRFGL